MVIRKQSSVGSNRETDDLYDEILEMLFIFGRKNFSCKTHFLNRRALPLELDRDTLVGISFD